MAYKPKNVARYRDTSGKSPVGDGGINKAQVPGATGSNDRESQPVGAELNDQFAEQSNRNQQQGSDFTIMDRGRDDENPRSMDRFGKRSYSAGTPTL